MWFTSHKQDTTELEAKIKKLEQRIMALETDNINVLAQMKMFRDKFLRRFKGENTNVEEPTQVINPFMV